MANCGLSSDRLMDKNCTVEGRIDDEDGTVRNAYNDSQNQTGARPMSSNFGKVLDEAEGVLISVDTSVEADVDENQILTSIKKSGSLRKSRSRQGN